VTAFLGVTSTFLDVNLSISRSDLNISRSDLSVSRSDLSISRSDLSISRCNLIVPPWCKLDLRHSGVLRCVDCTYRRFGTTYLSNLQRVQQLDFLHCL